MKTIEEKAKAYNRAIEQIRKLRDVLINNGVITKDGIIDYNFQRIFPELKESEDEKMLNQLHSWMKEFGGAEEYTEKVYCWIKGLLEKLDEKFIPENIDEAALQYVDTCAVDGEVTHDNVTEPYWNNHSMMEAYKAGWLKQSEWKLIWSEEDEKIRKELIKETKSSEVRLFEIVTNEEFIAWLEKHAEQILANSARTCKDEQTPAWSEEDKAKITKLKTFIAQCNGFSRANMVKVFAMIDSLTPYSQWKPSDGQMGALKEACGEHWEPDGLDPLYTLYQDLKKLKA